MVVAFTGPVFFFLEKMCTTICITDKDKKALSNIAF